LAQKVCCPLQQLVEVHPNGAQNGIEPVPLSPAQAVAIHSMLPFQVANPWFDRRSPFHPPPQAPGGSASVAFINMDLNFSRVSVPPVAHVHKGMRGIFTGNPLDLLQRIAQRVTVVGIAVYCHGTGKPPAATGGCHTDFATKLVSFMRLALADALNLRFVNAVNFLLVMPLLLEDAGSNR